MTLGLAWTCVSTAWKHPTDPCKGHSPEVFGFFKLIYIYFFASFWLFLALINANCLTVRRLSFQISAIRQDWSHAHDWAITVIRFTQTPHPGSCECERSEEFLRQLGNVFEFFFFLLLPKQIIFPNQSKSIVIKLHRVLEYRISWT